MIQCDCGRQFDTSKALEHHRQGCPTDLKSYSSVSVLEYGQVNKKRSKPAAQKAWLWESADKSDLKRSIAQATLKGSPFAVTSSEPPTLICSYSWKKDMKPMFWVPGKPPKFQQAKLPTRLRAESGTSFIDQNSARSPNYSFWPMFEAARIMSPDFNFDDVDVVVNRNSLRKLLDFCAGHSQPDFKLNLYIVNNTLVVERSERKDTELLKPSDGRFGHSFEEHFTSTLRGLDRSSDHHRVLQYVLGNLRCVVRFEVDAYYEDDIPGDDFESVLHQMGNMSLATTSVNKTAAVSQSSLAELKTTRKPKRTALFLPQLWFGRTPWLIVGHHENGTFNKVEITHAAPLFKQWELEQQASLRKLVTILTEMKATLCLNHRHGSVAVYENGPVKTLQIFQLKNNRLPLPRELIAQSWKSQ